MADSDELPIGEAHNNVRFIQLNGVDFETKSFSFQCSWDAQLLDVDLAQQACRKGCTWSYC